MAGRTPLTRSGALRIGAVAVAALIVAEGAVWLLRPRGGTPQPLPVSAHAYFSEAQLQRAEDFRGGQRLIGLGGLALSGGTLLLLTLWRPAPLRRAFGFAARRPLLGAAAVGAGVSLTLAVVSLPLGALAHERARDVGLSTQSLGGWLDDRGRAAAVGTALAALAGVAALAILRRLGNRFWIAGTALAIAAAAVFTWLAPVLLAPLFNRFEPLSQGPRRAAIVELGRRAGVEIGEVYRVDASRRSTALNAYVDGLGPSKRVVIYDNALRDLSPAELRSVVAHELSHVKDADIRRGLLFVALVAPLGVLFAQLLATALARRAGDDVRTPAVLPALALSVGLAVLVLGVPGNRLSRQIEARADAFALELTRDPASMIALQRRLSVANVGDPDPPALSRYLFGTHPATIERIGAAAAFERQHRDRP